MVDFENTVVSVVAAAAVDVEVVAVEHSIVVVVVAIDNFEEY